MSERFLGSLRARRIGVVLLAAMLVGYLAAITYWRHERSTAAQLLVLAGLWALGILALALLARAWRRR